MNNEIKEYIMNSATIINEMLTPSVLISGIGFLLFNFNTHYESLINKIKEMDHQIFSYIKQKELDKLDKARYSNIKQQINNLILRCKLTKYAIFILYIAMIFTIFSILVLAAEMANILLFIPNVPVISFIIAVILLFISVIVQIYEITLALRLFDKDFRIDYEDIAKS